MHRVGLVYVTKSRDFWVKILREENELFMHIKHTSHKYANHTSNYTLHMPVKVTGSMEGVKVIIKIVI
jgi:hypothetical protein